MVILKRQVMKKLVRFRGLEIENIGETEEIEKTDEIEKTSEKINECEKVLP